MWLVATVPDSRGIERGKKTSVWSAELEFSVENKPEGDLSRKRQILQGLVSWKPRGSMGHRKE